MALIICPECGKEISDKAPHCIHCGCPISQGIESLSSESSADNGHKQNNDGKRETAPKGYVALAIVIILFYFIVVFVNVAKKFPIYRTCSRCKGVGVIYTGDDAPKDDLDLFSHCETCPDCNGTGYR